MCGQVQKECVLQFTNSGKRLETLMWTSMKSCVSSMCEVYTRKKVLLTEP